MIKLPKQSRRTVAAVGTGILIRAEERGGIPVKSIRYQAGRPAGQSGQASRSPAR